MHPNFTSHKHDHDHDHDSDHDDRRHGHRHGDGRRDGPDVGRGPCGRGFAGGRDGQYARAVFGLMGAVKAAAHTSPEQRAQVETLLADTRRAIYGLLAADTAPVTDAAAEPTE